MPCTTNRLVCPFCVCARRTDAPPSFALPASPTPKRGRNPEAAPRRLRLSAPFGVGEPDVRERSELRSVLHHPKRIRDGRDLICALSYILLGARKTPPGAPAAASRPGLESNLSAVPVSPRTSCGAGLLPASFEKPARRTREVVTLGARRWLYRHVASVCLGHSRADRRSLHNGSRHALPA